MRKQTPSSSLLDLSGAGVDGDDDPVDDSCPYNGLCCPDDPLDQVFNLDYCAFGYGLFESIGVGLSPPREPSGSGGCRGGGEEDCKSAVERVAFGARAAESSLGGSGSGGGAGSEVRVPGGGRGEDDAGSKSAAAEDMETETLDVKPVFGVAARAGASYMSAPVAGADYMSAPVAGGIFTPGAFSESKLLPLPSYDCFGALTAWRGDGAGAGASGMATPGAVPENRLLPLPDVGFDALTSGGASCGGERGMSAPDSVSTNRLPTLSGARSATPSAPPGTPFRWEHEAPSSSVATTPSDSSLSSASLVSESPPVTSLPKALGLARPRKPRTARRPQWSLICPLHLLPIAARHTHGGKSINVLNAGGFSSVDGGSSGGGGGEGGGSSGGGEGSSGSGSYHRRVVGRQRNRQVRKDRRCSHCGTSETPQWRMGPEGPGTLCNACGIRSKMDRLLPEYRPSTSPSFNGDEHSNRHRKVLKLREKKVRD